ncbi:MAG: GatB/YqeY domain-containing protein [Planctomycetes bacterium]|nr:GatB/YqeY domain-containing protein [Planctomycetota bacterium]
MSLKDDIKKRLMQAMKAKNADELTVLRQIKTEVMKFETSGADKSASDEDVMKILNSLAKQHQESIDIYKENDRKDLLDKEVVELEIIKSFLPQEINDDDLQVLVEEVISEVGASTKKDMGQVMKRAREIVAEKGLMADGRALSEKVKSLLS